MRYLSLSLICLSLLCGVDLSAAGLEAYAGNPHYAPQPQIQRLYFGYQYHLAAAQAETETPAQEQLEIAASMVELGLRMPIFFSEGRTVLSGGLAYRGWQFIYENYHKSEFLPDALHEMRYAVAVERRPSPERSWQFAVTPGIVSDFEDIDGDDFSVEVKFLYEWQNSDGALGLGAAYLDLFGKPLPLPLLEFVREGELTIDILLPLHAGLTQALGDNASIGIRSETSGGRFHVGEDFELADGRSSLNGRVEYFLWQAESELLWRPGGGFELSVHGGIDLVRRFQVDDTDGEGISSLDLKPGPYFGFEIGLRR